MIVTLRSRAAMRAPCSLIAALALGVAAPNAVAATFDGSPDAGPVLAGDAVLWGEHTADGGGAIKQDGQVIASYPAPTPADDLEGRGMRSLGASPTRIAYSLTDTRLEDDAAGTQVDVPTTTPFLSVAGGAFTNALGTCQAQRIATAVEGDTVAFAVDRATAPCKGGIYVNGRRIAAADYVEQVRVAGPYVAWLVGGPIIGKVAGTIVVADVKTGAKLARFPISGVAWGGFDIDAKGNIVAEHSRHLLGWTVRHPKRRVLTRLGSSLVATSGGHIAYVSTDKRGDLRSLNLIDLKGKLVKRFDRYGRTRVQTGEIALTDHRIAWSVRSGESFTAPGKVLTATF